jgi:RNA 3'-terminal phosphate cyclase (ATP)
MGATVTVTLDRAGFYPAGGGRVVVNIQPAVKLLPLHLPERGEIKRRLAKAVVAALPGDIAKRELKKVEQMLGWSGDQLQIRQLPNEWGPGNLLTLEIESQHVTEVFTGFGTKGVSAEAVAERAIQQARRYLAANVPVGEYLADQLLLPMAMAGGGSFLTHLPSEHTKTNMQVIARFLPVTINLNEIGPDICGVQAEIKRTGGY